MKVIYDGFDKKKEGNIKLHLYCPCTLKCLLFLHSYLHNAENKSFLISMFF